MTQIGESSYIEPEPEEPTPSNVNEISIRFSLFFDGTLNNRKNTRERQNNSAIYQSHQVKKKDNSYENDLSNIAIMQEYIEKADGYDHSYSSYIEGPGTENFKSDSSIGAGLGQGSTGVIAKVDVGLEDVINQIKKDRSITKDDYTVKLLTIDVFGFSRGAACARHFIHKALNTKRSSRRSRPAKALKKRLKMLGFNAVNEVEVCFVGLYDTVASHGMDHTNDTRVLNLDSIGVFKAKKVIQLAAADEHRINFSLTTVESAGGHAQQVFLPGVHADIGGCYVDNTNEKLLLNTSYSRETLEEDRNFLIRQGWYQENEIEIEDPLEYPMMVPAYGYMPPPQEYKLFGTRSAIKNEYSKVPLNIMAGFARKSGINIEGDLESDNKIPPGLLTRVYADIESYSGQSGSKVEDWQSHRFDWLKELRHNYCHFSANFDKNIMGVYSSNKPNIISGKRIRATHSG